MNKIKSKKNNLNKSVKIKAIVGLILFVVMIIGASYAYFGITSSIATTTRKAAINVNEKYQIVAYGYNIENVNLNAYQLSPIEDSSYILTYNGFKNFFNGFTDNNASINYVYLENYTDNDLYCDVEMTIEFVTIPGYPNIGSQIFNYGSANDMIFKFRKIDYDYEEISVKNSNFQNNKIIYNYGLIFLYGQNWNVISAEVFVNVTSDTDQSYLSNARATIKIYPSKISCSTAETEEEYQKIIDKYGYDPEDL